MTNLEKYGGEAWNFFISLCANSNCDECRFLQFWRTGMRIKRCYEAWGQEETKDESK